MNQLSEKKSQFVIVVSGPTGVGKTNTAIQIARHFQAEIISADSRQFFKEIPIGTAAPTQEELQAVPHHFVGNLSITDYYNAYMFQKEVLEILPSLFKKNKYVVLCGGSGMYIDAVCNGIDDIPDIDPELRTSVITQYKNEGLESLRNTLKKLDPDYYAEVDLKNPARLMRAIEVCIQTGKPFSSIRKQAYAPRDFSCIHIALSLPREELYTRINARVENMMEQGLEEEARSVFPYKEHTALKTVGYKELFAYFNKEYSKDFAIEKIKQHSRHYAKRQISWLKRNNEYTWFHPEDYTEIFNHIKEQ
ncbi:MAG: tRNA (adenosine(37)-N6)-dimethylallyltransferase MiaA [Bacteroidales bacterium]|jgi:tRNA dimethylallyltransferase|nr:tRNA (adenosine(37)-N6)-dimethylallyltransferase MiaA [Bacteroidales bacterium]